MTKPKAANNTQRTLWKAKLRVGHNGKDEFLFRSSEELGDASRTAQDLLESSDSCCVFSAVLVGVERIAKLWN